MLTVMVEDRDGSHVVFKTPRCGGTGRDARQKQIEVQSTAGMAYVGLQMPQEGPAEPPRCSRAVRDWSGQQPDGETGVDTESKVTRAVLPNGKDPGRDERLGGGKGEEGWLQAARFSLAVGWRRRRRRRERVILDRRGRGRGGEGGGGGGVKVKVASTAAGVPDCRVRPHLCSVPGGAAGGCTSRSGGVDIASRRSW